MTKGRASETTASGTTPKATKAKEENTEETVNIFVVQEMMKVQQETMLACFSKVVDTLSNKVDNILCDVQNLKTNLNFVTKDYETKFADITNNVYILKKELTDTRVLNARAHGVVQQHTEKLVDIEDRSRRNNLMIDGLSENDWETPEITEEKVKLLFKRSLGIEEHIEIDREHRVGRNEGKVRTIV